MNRNKIISGKNEYLVFLLLWVLRLYGLRETKVVPLWEYLDNSFEDAQQLAITILT